MAAAPSSHSGVADGACAMALLLMAALLATMMALSTNPILNERLRMFAPYKLFSSTVNHIVISAKPLRECGFLRFSSNKPKLTIYCW
jgi:hypothetical protein